MRVFLFLCLLLAHLVADFYLQTEKSCRDKKERRWRSPYQYGHACVVFGLSWLAAWDVDFWWCALLIGISHFLIDIWKSYKEESVVWFTLDQAMHVLVLVCTVLLWCSRFTWTAPLGLDVRYVAIFVAILLCWRPANLFIKLTLKHYSVNMPKEQESGFNAGALIGTIERWLILVFVCMQRYDALGLLIAAKSIIRFGDSQMKKSEYVLAGTLLSIFIAVIVGLGVMSA